jgi:FixJ family two-component response regulator
MAEPSDWIAIVDDDPAVLRALARLLGTRSLRAKTYRSAQEFLASVVDPLPICLLLDLQMPDMTGFELQQELVRKGIVIPTIIVTAHDEARMRARCKAAGAVAFLSKPLQDISLFAAIDAATRQTRR